MINYLLVLLGTAIYYSIYAYLSKVTNDVQSTKMMMITFVFGALCPFWVLMTKISNNLLRDAFIYDFILTSAFMVTLILLGTGETFTKMNWLGALFVFLGIIFMRMK